MTNTYAKQYFKKGIKTKKAKFWIVMTDRYYLCTWLCLLWLFFYQLSADTYSG